MFETQVGVDPKHPSRGGLGLEGGLEGLEGLQGGLQGLEGLERGLQGLEGGPREP